ncbi:hypothetical protein ACOSP7_020808 [Xanthoceras sorbifolium]
MGDGAPSNPSLKETSDLVRRDLRMVDKGKSKIVKDIQDLQGLRNENFDSIKGGMSNSINERNILNQVSKGVCLHRKGPGDKAVVSSIEGAGPKIGDPLLLKTGEAQFRGSDLVGPESITDGPVYDMMDSTSSGLGSTVGIDTGQAVAIAFLSTVFHF